MSFQRTFHLICLSILCWKSLDGQSTYDLLYADVRPANLSESFQRIRTIPLKHYEFVYDSVPGRRQMGVIGPDALQHFPESVEVMPTYTIPNKDRKLPPTILNNYPLVDKSIIFMHGLAAVQELIGLHDLIDKSLSNLLDSRKDYNLKIAEIERRLSIEIDTQLIESKELAKLQVEIAKKELELDTFKADEEKNAIETELKEEKALLLYEEELARKRISHQEQLATASMEKTLELERDLAEKRELLYRETTEILQKKKMEYSMKLEEKKKENEMEKIRAEIEAKAELERANEDVTIRKMQAQAQLDTQRMIDSIKTISLQVTLIAKEFLSKPERLVMMIAVLLGFLIVYYALRELIVVLREFIKARLGRPSLVRETSVHWSILPDFISPFYWYRMIFTESLMKGKKNIEDHLENVILSNDDKSRVVQIALATRNTKKSGAPFRHLLLHGPPGTGKTLIARKLAECSGMDYAVMSGGDVGPLGEDAISQLHGLFRW
eukprot:CAMPEP_0119044704 /NCGR_PEP_ID=MMETSP1177-20130426/33738_1 /TAXON_ID=2985 /ORGANISM="Ochromonas sp, Strain CCMP1899" /LENGTH=494 /DNA_ID=CAMNT_0007015221 /DNA_START=59 /DNA_END=1540 /DNA_ORIENTATION=-